MTDLQSKLYDTVVVACFSVHRLRFSEHRFHYPVVLGILEASITTAPNPIDHDTETWGVVTTGAFWEHHLTLSVRNYLGQDIDAKGKTGAFAGLFTTGLNAGDFHSISADTIQERLRNAARRLLESGSVKYVIIGWAGMTGLKNVIRSKETELHVPESASKLYVVDAVQAGILQTETTVRSKRAFL